MLRLGRFLALGLLFAGPALAQSRPIAIALSFDPATADFLQGRGEMVVVASWFFGDPAPGNSLPLDEMGMIYLGTEEATVWPVDQTVFVGGSLGGAPVGSVVAPMVNVNVFSARITDDNNLLDCGIVEAPITQLVTEPQAIHCKLIE